MGRVPLSVALQSPLVSPPCSPTLWRARKHLKICFPLEGYLPLSQPQPRLNCTLVYVITSGLNLLVSGLSSWQPSSVPPAPHLRPCSRRRSSRHAGDATPQLHASCSASVLVQQRPRTCCMCAHATAACAPTHPLHARPRTCAWTAPMQQSLQLRPCSRCYICAHATTLAPAVVQNQIYQAVKTCTHFMMLLTQCSAAGRARPFLQVTSMQVPHDRPQCCRGRRSTHGTLRRQAGWRQSQQGPGLQRASRLPPY